MPADDTFVVLELRDANHITRLGSCPNDIRNRLLESIAEEERSVQAGLTKAGKARKGIWRGVRMWKDDLRRVITLEEMSDIVRARLHQRLLRH